MPVPSASAQEAKRCVSLVFRFPVPQPVGGLHCYHRYYGYSGSLCGLLGLPEAIYSKSRATIQHYALSRRD